MEVLEAIKTRRSVRSFTGRPVSDEDVIKILDAARLAPSAGNRQTWIFVYVKDAQTLRMLKNCCPGFYGDAASAIVICAPDGARGGRSLDVGFACENIALAAHSLGIGSCPIASFNREPVRALINIPRDYEAVLVVSLGYPDATPASPRKKSLDEVVYLDAFGKKWDKLGGI